MADIRVHKLVAQGGLDKNGLVDTQTLLVVGSARSQGDIWVGFDSDAPKERKALLVSWIERASFAEVDAVATLDVGVTGRVTPFSIPLEDGETFWIARFDISDHDKLNEHWQRFVAKPAADTKEAFRTVA